MSAGLESFSAGPVAAGTVCTGSVSVCQTGKDACRSSQGPSQPSPSLSPVQLSTGSEAGLKSINSITTTANAGEQFISGNRGGRISAGPTRTTGSTRQQDSSTLPCWQGLTLLTIPSFKLDCSSVWLLILMLLLFLHIYLCPMESFTVQLRPICWLRISACPTYLQEIFRRGLRRHVVFLTSHPRPTSRSCACGAAKAAFVTPSWVNGHGKGPKEEEL